MQKLNIDSKTRFKACHTCLSLNPGLAVIDHTTLVWIFSRGIKDQLMEKSRLRDGTEPAIFVPKLLSNMTVSSFRYAGLTIFEYSWVLALFLDWIITIGNCSIVSTKFYQKRQLFHRLCMLGNLKVIYSSCSCFIPNNPAWSISAIKLLFRYLPEKEERNIHFQKGNSYPKALRMAWRHQSTFTWSISYPESVILLVSQRWPKTCGLWERDWHVIGSCHLKCYS